MAKVLVDPLWSEKAEEEEGVSEGEWPGSRSPDSVLGSSSWGRQSWGIGWEEEEEKGHSQGGQGSSSSGCGRVLQLRELWGSPWTSLCIFKCARGVFLTAWSRLVDL